MEKVTLSPKQLKAKWLTFWALIFVALGSVGMDQASKVMSETNLMRSEDPENIRIYQGQRYPIAALGALDDPEKGLYLALNFSYVRNTGAAWGFLADLPDQYRIPFFYLVTFFAVCAIFWYLRETPLSHRVARYALVLILSGAFGNFIDRIRIGYVIDWIDVRWRIFGWRYDFPNFNIADSAISVGLFLLLLDMFIIERKRLAIVASQEKAHENA